MVRHEDGFLPAHDNLRLFWVQDLPETEPRAFVGIVHGMGDHIGRYAAPIRALNAAGFGVLGFDYRGHGRSEGRRGHVDRFGDYVSDMERFVSKLKEAAGPKKVFLLGHSHGALVTATYLQERTPTGISGAIFSAPYLGLAFKPPAYKTVAASLLTRVIPFLPIASGLKETDFSRDEAWQQETAADPLYGRKVTPRWYSEHLVAQVRALAGAPSLKLPSLVLCAGEDRIASNEKSRAFFEALGSADKRLIELPQMRHELLNELGKEGVYREIVSWISAHL